MPQPSARKKTYRGRRTRNSHLQTIHEEEEFREQRSATQPLVLGGQEVVRPVPWCDLLSLGWCLACLDWDCFADMNAACFYY